MTAWAFPTVPWHHHCACGTRTRPDSTDPALRWCPRCGALHGRPSPMAATITTGPPPFGTPRIVDGFEAWMPDREPSRGTGTGSVVGTLGGTPPGGGWRFGADEAAAGQLVPTGFHLTQHPISEYGLTPAMSAGNRNGCATLGVSFAQNQRGEVVESPYTHQLTTGGGKPGQGYPAARIGSVVRRLTPLECERLQGFPDGWTAGRSDSARYRMLGNAVTVLVAEWIGRRLAAAIREWDR